MPRRLLQALPHAVMLAFTGFLYWSSLRIDTDASGASRIGPDAWPKAIILFMALLCAWQVLLRLARPAPPGSAPAPAGPDAGGVAPAEHPAKLWGGIALVTGYVVAAPWLGFFVATAIFLAAFPWVGGLRRPLFAASIGALGSLLLVVLFMRVAYISLPLGEGPFRALSLALLRVLGVT